MSASCHKRTFQSVAPRSPASWARLPRSGNDPSKQGLHDVVCVPGFFHKGTYCSIREGFSHDPLHACDKKICIWLAGSPSTALRHPSMVVRLIYSRETNSGIMEAPFWGISS
jgi:hypothetical protein